MVLNDSGAEHKSSKIIHSKIFIPSTSIKFFRKHTLPQSIKCTLFTSLFL